MHTITKVSCENVRGLTKEVELGPKTLIVGANGAGKSTIAHAISLAVDGYIPDTVDANKKGDYIFANSSGEEMSALAVIGDHTVSRSWAKTKKGSITQAVKVDDVDAKKNGAGPLIEMALGKKKVMVDVPAFWNKPASEQQRIILSSAIDPDVLAGVMEQEKKTREAKNALADDRRAAEKALQNMTEQLAGMDTIEGNLDHIKQELEGLRTEERKLRQKIAESEANERARTEMRGTIDQLGEAEKELEYVEGQITHTAGVVQNLGKACRVHGDTLPDTPADTLPPGYFAKKIECALSALYIGIVDDENVLIERIQEASLILTALLPNPEAEQAGKKAMDKWQAQDTLIKRELSEAEKQANELDRKKSVLVERITSAREAGDKLASIGPGVDSNDIAGLNAVSEKIKVLDDQIEPLAEVAALNGSLEKTRLDIERITGEEEGSKDELAKLTQKQAELVQGANDNLARLSKEVLPYGELELVADGKSLSIFWAKDEILKVRRHTLSGGELAIFDAAVGHALGDEATVVIEAAECDDEHLIQLMDHLETKDFQAIVLTCHRPPFTIPDGWKMIEVV